MFVWMDIFESVCLCFIYILTHSLSSLTCQLASRRLVLILWQSIAILLDSNPSSSVNNYLIAFVIIICQPFLLFFQHIHNSRWIVFFISLFLFFFPSTTSWSSGYISWLLPNRVKCCRSLDSRYFAVFPRLANIQLAFWLEWWWWWLGLVLFAMQSPLRSSSSSSSCYLQYIYKPDKCWLVANNYMRITCLLLTD